MSSCAVSVAFTSTSLLSGYPLLGTSSLVCLNSRFVVLVFVKEEIQTVFALVSSCLWLNSLCNNSAATAVPLSLWCVVYSKIIATTTAALVLDTESEREKKKPLYHRLSFLLPSFAGTNSKSRVLVAALELYSSRDKLSSHFLPLFLFAHFPSMSIHWKPVVVAFQSFAIPGAT